MTPGAVLAGVRRLRPRRMRTRLAVMYSVVFLLVGAALLVLTYTLVAHVLLPDPAGTKPIPPRLGSVLAECKQSGLPGHSHAAAALVQTCNRPLIAAGAGPRAQRAAELDALGNASVIGLGVLAIASIALGWLIAGRTLRPVRSITQAAGRAADLRLGQRL